MQSTGSNVQLQAQTAVSSENMFGNTSESFEENWLSTFNRPWWRTLSDGPQQHLHWNSSTFPFGTSRLSENSCYFWRTKRKVKDSFQHLLLQFLPVALAHNNHSDLKKSIPPMFNNTLFETEMGHQNVFQLPFLWFWLVSQTVWTVLVILHQ